MLEVEKFIPFRLRKRSKLFTIKTKETINASKQNKLLNRIKPHPASMSAIENAKRYFKVKLNSTSKAKNKIAGCKQDSRGMLATMCAYDRYKEQCKAAVVRSKYNKIIIMLYSEKAPYVGQNVSNNTGMPAERGSRVGHQKISLILWTSFKGLILWSIYCLIVKRDNTLIVLNENTISLRKVLGGQLPTKFLC